MAPKLLLKNENLRTSVDAARLDVKNSTVYVEFADSRASFNADALEKFQKRQDAELIKLPYLSVNVVVKNMDNPFNINDFRSGENDEEQNQTDLWSSYINTKFTITGQFHQIKTNIFSFYTMLKGSALLYFDTMPKC